LRAAWLATAIGFGAFVEENRAEAFSYPGEAARVEKRLGSTDAAERLRAARQLTSLSPSVAHPVVKRALADEDAEVRVAAARAAVGFRFHDLGSQVVGWLMERDVRLRQAATEVLRLGPIADAVEPLGRVLSDADERVRLGAADALGAVGAGDGIAPDDARRRAATALLGHLDDTEPRVRVAVTDALAKLGDARAALPLVSKLQDGEPEVRVAVTRALGVLADPRATSALVVALGDRESAVVAQAAQALGWIGEASVEPSLWALATSTSSAVVVRRAAVRALGKLGSRENLPRLVRLLAEPTVASEAEQALSRLGGAAEPALDGCVSATLGATNATCARLLAKLRGPEATSTILEALRRGSLEPASAVAALGRTGSSEAVVVALELLAHPDAPVRSAALGSLLELLETRGPDARATGPLLDAYERTRPTPLEQARLLTALGLTGAPEAAELLAQLAVASDVSIRVAALAALGGVSSAEGEKVLLAALDDSSGEVRRVAALSLRASGGVTSARELVQRFATRDGQDRAAVALALRGPLSKTSEVKLTQEVARLLERAQPGARDSLIEALAAAGAREEADRAFERLLREGTNADRAKLAEVANSGAPRVGLLRRLVADPDPLVRAQASWSLGQVGESSQDRELLVRSLGDADGAVRANSAAALAVLMERQLPAADVSALAKRLCVALSDAVPAVRASAVVALGKLGAAADTCGTLRIEQSLHADSAEEVRRLAALVVRRLGGARKAFELRRCAAFEVSPKVAEVCLAGEADAAASISQTPAAAPRSALPDLAFVVLRPGAQPAPRAPFVVIERGVIRAGTTDRRGTFAFERAGPHQEAPRLLELGLLRPD
jgi:HEAT repeat protein